MRVWPVVAALLLCACSAAAPDRALSPATLAPDAWIEITPEPLRVDGRVIRATCSHAPGADGAFRFWARRGASNNLVIFLDGGGACWDDLTCSIPRLAGSRDERDGFYKAELLPSDNPNAMQGLFDLDNPRNPVRDWSFVYVPYCTGDVHSGSNSARYVDVDTGEPFIIEHRGADNFRVVLNWARAHFRRPQQILVAGSSAGAYGAATHFARVREAYPEGRAVMLGDAGQGVTTPEFLPRRNANWRYQLPEIVFGRDTALTADNDIVARLAAHFPRDRFAQYTTAHDRTQVAFYAFMGGERACSSWTELMRSALARRQGLANFRSYVATGERHTILRSAAFYTEASGGEPFAEWLAHMLSADDGAWQNRSCEVCGQSERPVDRCPFGN